MLKKILLTLTTCLSFMSISAQAVSDQDIVVKAQKNGDVITIDMNVTVPVVPEEAWAVMVDFDHMPNFLPNLQSSKILEKNGNKWKVAQKGQSSHAGFSVSFESVREVELVPFESIRSHLLSGTMKKQDGVTQLTPSGTGTHIVYHSESIANVWVPPMLGTSVIEDEVRRQFQEMSKEMLKRHAGTK